MRSRNFAEIWLPVAMLLLLAAYTYAGLVLFPYLGFQFLLSTGEINDVFVAGGGLELGDRIVSSEDLGWNAYQNNLHEPLRPEARFMQSVQIEIERGGTSQVVEWAMPGFTNAEFGSRLLSIWPYGFVFWLAGTLTLLLVRPRSPRRSLLAAFFYVTAIWLVAGNFSRMHVLESAFVMRAALWMSLPIYLHFHWNFPQRIDKAPAWTWPVLYGLGVLGAVLQWTNVLSPGVYAVPFGLAVLGSASILLFRYVRRPAERRETGLLLAAALIALVPASLSAVAANLGLPIPFGLQLALYSLIALPGAYFYVVYRRQLGGLEFRANRVISIYLYLLILLLALLLLIPAFNSSASFPEAELGLIIMAVLLTAVITVVGFGGFQRFVERRLLNMPLPPEHLLTSFAGKISTSLTMENLLQVLDEEILPSLLIRQSTLIACGEDNRVHVLLEQGLSPKQLPSRAQIDGLLKQAKGASEVRRLHVRGRDLAWVRLAFAIMAGDKAIGLWLLGERDPDDYYSQAEAVLLASLADQMAIALENIAQATRLRGLYQLDIDQQEAERSRLALELHDDALNRFGELKTLVVEKGHSAEFERGYQELADLLRSTIHGLRPPMLEYGLYSALEALVDELAGRGSKLRVNLDVPASDIRHDRKIEQHLFRIVQQACENALRHANASQLTISGSVGRENVELLVDDDGDGFELEGGHDLVKLLTERHFGLAGMSERAALVGATLDIRTAPHQGTTVVIRWAPSPD